MNKKILDAAVVTVFFMGLFVMSDIAGSTRGSSDTNGYSLEQRTGKTEVKINLAMVTAGASRVLSEDSFTTESEEVANVKRDQRFFVTAPQIIFDEGGMKKQTTVLRTSVLIGQTEDEETEQNKIDGTGTEGNETAGTAIVGTNAKVTEKKGVKTEQSVTDQTETYSNRWNITLTEEEIELLARIVWLEANGEPVEGQEAVVEVVLNRMVSELYPDTLYDVLSQKNPVQFCTWKNRDHAKPTEKEYESIRQVLYGNTQILRSDTLYFSTTPLTANVDIRIGGHSFCY